MEFRALPPRLHMNEESKCYRKFSNKRVNAKKEKIEFKLTFEEWKKLLIEAKISYNDIGIKGYHLARFNDSGPYEVGNCRFVYYLDNLKEKKFSQKSKEASTKNITTYNKSTSKEERQRTIQKFKETWSKKREHYKPHNILSREDVIKKYELITSLVDLNRRGAISKAAKLLNCSHTCIRRYINRYNKLQKVGGSNPST